MVHRKHGKIMRNIDWTAWRGLDRDQKIRFYKAMKKTADRRLRRLREAGYRKPLETADYLERKGVKTFPALKKEMKEWEINSALLEAEKFLTNQRSTISGIKKSSRAILDNIIQRMNEFREDKIDVDMRSGVEKQKIYNFLHSRQFSRLKHDIDSDIVVEMYNDALSDGLTSDEIEQELEKYLENDFSFQQMKRELKKQAQIKRERMEEDERKVRKANARN